MAVEVVIAHELAHCYYFSTVYGPEELTDGYAECWHEEDAYDMAGCWWGFDVARYEEWKDAVEKKRLEAFIRRTETLRNISVLDIFHTHLRCNECLQEWQYEDWQRRLRTLGRFPRLWWKCPNGCNDPQRLQLQETRGKVSDSSSEPENGPASMERPDLAPVVIGLDIHREGLPRVGVTPR